MYDITIIGLGPAGATLARLLDKSFKVLLIDKKSGNEDTFKKPCGGLLAKDAQKALSRFNLTLPKEVLVDPQIFAVKTIDTKQNLLRYYQRFYINLDRHKFDMWLISLIPKNIQIENNSYCSSIEKLNGFYELTYIKDKKEYKVKTKYLVGADGSNSLVRSKLFPKRKIKQYLSIQEWFQEEHITPFYSCIFDKDITDSYCWSISKNGYFILGGAFKKENGKKSFELLKEKLHKKGFLFDTPIKTEACLVSMPKGIKSFYTGSNGAFLIGEAAGFISPSSLEGISYAFNSAYELSKVLNSRCKNPERRYRIKSIPIKVKLLLKYLKSPFMYQPFLRKVVMKSGLNSIEVLD